MAQGGIRKGFFFYFGLLVLLVIAVFLIILVILFFNPGKTILGLQYFTNGETVQLQTTTDDETPFNFTSGGNVRSIDIDCSYANVYVQVSEDIHENCVQITNEASGFATYKQARPYEYSVTLEGTTLKIDVTESVGFLYFSRNVSIIINIEARYFDGSVSYDGNYQGITFDIQTTSGNVYLGTGDSNAYEIRPNNVMVETTSGNIYLSKNLDLSGMNTLSLETGSGEITTDSYNVSVDGGSNLNGRGIVMNSGEVNLTTNTGLMDFDLIRINNNGVLNLSNENGNMTIGEIDVNSVNLNALEGNYYFDKVTANILSFTPSEDRIESPNIRVGSLTGDFVISSSENNSTPNINIDKLVGDFASTGVNGSFNIGEITGEVRVDTRSGSLNVNFVSSGTLYTDTITTERGNITVGFLGVCNHDMNIWTDSGKVTINVVDETGFTSTVYDYAEYSKDEAERTPLANDTDRITVNIGTHEAVKNPLDINPSTGSSKGTFTIYTNDEVEYVKE